jgi:hypothetical protein
MIAIAITNLIEYGIDSDSPIKCIWGTRVKRRRAMTGIVTMTILYRRGESNGIECEFLLG